MVHLYGSNLLVKKSGVTPILNLRLYAIQKYWRHSGCNPNLAYTVYSTCYKEVSPMKFFPKVNQERQGKIGETHFALDFFQGRC